jgi:hypothetical protein
MNRRRYMAWLGSALVAAGALGCNGDEEPAGLVNAGGGGADGGGHAGSAGAAGSGVGTDAALDQSALPDGRSPDASSDGNAPSETGEASTDAGDAGTQGFAVFVGSDFVGGVAKVTAVDWGTKQIAGSTAFNNVTSGDALAFTRGGRAFMLERSDDKLVIQQAQPWLAAKTVDLTANAPANGNDPFAVISTGTKAYVPLYHRNAIAIVDVNLGTVTGSVDLSSFTDAADADGLVDVFDGAYDPTSHRAYFLLQRIPQLEQGIEPDRASHCISVQPAIVAVDTTNDQLVDLNGDAGGTAAVLLGQNPSAFVPDLAGGRLLVVDAGCYSAEGGTLDEAGADAQASVVRSGRGIEALSLASGTSAWVYTHNAPGRLSGLVWVDSTRAFIAIDGGKDEFYATHWHSWNPTTPATIGAEVTGFPLSARYLGNNKIVGLSFQTVDGGSADAVVSFDVGSSTTTTLVPDLFGSSSYYGDYNGWGLVP